VIWGVTLLILVAICKAVFVRQRKMPLLTGVKARLRGPGLLRGGDGPNFVWGDALGVQVTFRYVKIERSMREDDELTLIEVELPPKIPLALSVRRSYTGGMSSAERDPHRDLSSGDAEFARCFNVEAAPFDVAVQLLDAPTRASLLALPVNRLFVKVGEKAALHLELHGWIEEPAACTAVELIASFPERVRQAYARAEEAAATPGGAPFRAEGDGQQQRDAAAAREADLAAVRQRRIFPDER
jgi:hypothetical protein